MRENETIIFKNKPGVLCFASIGGKKEKEGPLGHSFDITSDDSLFGEESFEKAESKMQQLAIETALNKKNLHYSDIDCIFAGDLLNQCISSSFGLRETNMPFVGVYGACSTMALTLGLASIFIDGGAAQKTISVTSSHFCSAERQYRFPLEYGSQRTPTAQWTVTGSGAVVLTAEPQTVYVNSVTFGTVQDLGVKDQNNMGAAMAPDDVKIRPYPIGCRRLRLCRVFGCYFRFGCVKNARNTNKYFAAFRLAKTKIT